MTKMLRFMEIATCIILCLFQLSFCVGDEPIICHIGFGSKLTEVIPPERINDGYCDCPADGGIDEFETEACSGSGLNGWAGNRLISDVSLASFQCTQQKNLLLPTSRVNDGICDCCDGSDESSGDCEDICDVVLAEERAQRERLKVAFSDGYLIRMLIIKEFLSIKLVALRDINTLTDREIPHWKSETSELKDQLKDTRLSYASDRFQKMNDIFSTLKLPGNLEQLQTLIASVCQMSGEINHNIQPQVNDKKTCVSLRRAGLDLGIIWDSENLEMGTSNVRLGAENDDQLALEIVDVLYNNYVSEETDSFEKDYKPQHNDSWESRKSRDNEKDKQHKKYYEYDDNEDIMDEIHGMDEETEVNMADSSEKYSYSSPIGIWRQNFYHFAVDMLEKVDELLNSDINEELEESETAPESNNNDTADESFDPMEMQMLKTFLERRISYIDTGNAFAQSAVVLLSSLANLSEMSAEKWMQLAAGTIFYSNLSVTDIAEIVTLYDVEESDSCISPYTSMCPPQQTQMKSLDDTVITFPSTEALSLISQRCALRQGNEHKCDVDIESDEIPLSFPDGYFDYYAVSPREDDDPYSKQFSQIDYNENALLTLKDLTQSFDDANQKLAELENEVNNLKESIGGDDDTFYGIDGELYSFKEECFEINAGKYTYELCMYGQAQQKEGSARTGTSLGNWEGWESLEDTGERVFKWSGGTKCWNGPNRSATAYVTCGSETKIISAEEPNICQYEFEMESPVACDETFRRIYDL